MHDALLVRVPEPPRDLDRDAQCLARRDGADPEAPRQRLAPQQLQDEVRPVLAAADVVEGDDVRMRETGGELGLSQHALLTHVRPSRSAHGLEGDRATGVQVYRFIDDPETAAPDLSDELI